MVLPCEHQEPPPLTAPPTSTVLATPRPRIHSRWSRRLTAATGGAESRQRCREDAVHGLPTAGRPDADIVHTLAGGIPALPETAGGVSTDVICGGSYTRIHDRRPRMSPARRMASWPGS